MPPNIEVLKQAFRAKAYTLTIHVMGYTASGRVLHLQVSYPPNVKVITAYEPSSDDWEADWKTRRT